MAKRKGQENSIVIKPVDLSGATRKEDLDRLRGLQWFDDPERGPENKGKGRNSGRNSHHKGKKQPW